MPRIDFVKNIERLLWRHSSCVSIAFYLLLSKYINYLYIYITKDTNQYVSHYCFIFHLKVAIMMFLLLKFALFSLFRILQDEILCSIYLLIKNNSLVSFHCEGIYHEVF